MQPRLPLRACHGHKAGKCHALAVTPDNMCQPCHDKVEQELAKPTEPFEVTHFPGDAQSPRDLLNSSLRMRCCPSNSQRSMNKLRSWSSCNSTSNQPNRHFSYTPIDSLLGGFSPSKRAGYFCQTPEAPLILPS